MLSFLRFGRGVSFHEFELAMMPVDQLQIVSCLSTFLRDQHVVRRIVWRVIGQQYEHLLMRACPRIPVSFYQPYLDIIVRK